MKGKGGKIAARRGDLDSAVERGDAEEVRRLLREGALIREGKNCEAGVKAAMHGDADCLKELIEAGWDVDAWASSAKYQAGHYAAEEGHAECLRVLLDAGWDPESKDGCGWEAGHGAAKEGHLECLCMLIEAGWDPNVRLADGATAGHLAASNGKVECLLALIEAGLDLEARDERGRTAEASARRQGAMEAAELLEGMRRAREEKASMAGVLDPKRRLKRVSGL